jgi:hypothetical protein
MCVSRIKGYITYIKNSQEERYIYQEKYVMSKKTRQAWVKAMYSEIEMQDKYIFYIFLTTLYLNNRKINAQNFINVKVEEHNY